MAKATTPVSKPGNTSTNDTPFDSDADMWRQRFQTCEQNQRTLFKRTQKHYDIMYAVLNSDTIAPWRSKVYIPILASKAWDLIARFSDVTPYFNVDIQNETQADPETDELSYTQDSLERAEKIELKLQSDYTNGSIEPMSLKVFDTLLDATVAGTGFAKTPWCYDQKTSYARPVDTTTGMIKSNSKVIKKTIKGGHNDFVPVNFFNVFMPGKTGFYEQPYMIVREFTDIDTCAQDKRFTKTAMRKLQQMNNIPGEFMQYNQSRDRLTMQNNQQFDESLKNIVLYECYAGNGDIITYGEGKSENGWVEMERKTGIDAYWTGRPSLVPFKIRKKSFSPWGESLFENNARLGNAINDLFNHYLDNWNLSIDQMLIYQSGTLVGDYVVKPGGEITYSGNQAPAQFKMTSPDPQQLTTPMDVINQAIESATVPQYLSGVPDSELDKTGGTATGINQITEAATEKVGFMRNNIKWAMEIVGKNWLSNLQQFEDRPAEVKTVKKGVKRPALIMPGDYQGEMNVSIDDDSMTPVSKQTRLQTFQGYMGTLTSLQQMGMIQAQTFGNTQDIPRFKIDELIDEASQAYGYKDYTKFIDSNDSSQPANPAAGLAAMGAQNGQQPQPGAPQPPQPPQQPQPAMSGAAAAQDASNLQGG